MKGHTRYPSEAEIFARISRIELARLWGVRFTGRTNGEWHECHAVDREDRTPSAGINAESGAYKDFAGGDDEQPRFWDIAVRLGLYADWRDARDDAAREAGLLDDDRRRDPYRPAPPKPRPEKNEAARSPCDEKPTPVFPTAEVAAADLLRMFGSPGMRAKVDGFVPDDGVPTLYRYSDADGRRVGAVCRIDGTKGDGSRSKRITPLRCDADGWRRKAMTVPRTLYRLSELLAEPRDIVVVVEGEKAADEVAKLIDDLKRADLPHPLVVTTNAGGASAYAKTDWTPLAGRRVLLWPDHDEAGRKWRDGLTLALTRLARPARVRWVDPVALWPEVREGDDAFDWIMDRNTVLSETLVESLLAASVAPPGTTPDPQRKGGPA